MSDSVVAMFVLWSSSSFEDGKTGSQCCTECFAFVTDIFGLAVLGKFDRTASPAARWRPCIWT